MSALCEAEKIIGKEQNPVREEINEIASKAKLGFIVNAILNREGRIVKVVAGDFIKAFKEGVYESRKVWEVKVPEKADIVIADPHPADIDMWQAAKRDLRVRSRSYTWRHNHPDDSVLGRRFEAASSSSSVRL